MKNKNLLSILTLSTILLFGCDAKTSTQQAEQKVTEKPSTPQVKQVAQPKVTKQSKTTSPTTPRDIEYKVETFNGAPFITEDGKPVRGRVFWGSVGGTTRDKLDENWQDVSFEYTAEKDFPAHIHISAGEAPGKIYYTNLKVENLTIGKTIIVGDFGGEKNPRARKLSFWCQGVNDTPPVKVYNENVDGKDATILHIKQRTPKVLGSHFYVNGFDLKKGNKYRFSITAKATPHRTLNFSIYDVANKKFTFVKSNGTNTFTPQIICAKDGGVDFVSFGISGVWTKPNEKPNYAYIDKVFAEILKANPNAKLWPRVGVDAPRWWRAENQDHLIKDSNGVINNAYASVSSKKYREDANKALRLFVEYCEKNYPKNMSGYMPTGQNTGEWFYGGTWLKPINGYDTQTIKAWRKWLVKKYGSNANLQKAWNRTDVTLATVTTPTAIERNGNAEDLKYLESVNYLVDVSTHQNVVDFNIFLQDEMSGLIGEFGNTIRKAAPRRLSIIFYAYGFEFAGVRNGPAVSGHYGLRNLLNMPQIDIICGPISYHDRKFGDAKTVMGAAESIAKSGKIWLDEDDTSTYLDVKIPGRCPATDVLTDTREKTIKVLSRNLAQEAIRNQASWWMDLFGDGWFNDPELWKQMKRFDKAERDMIANPTEYAPDIAAIIDEHTMSHIYGSSASIPTTAKLMLKARDLLNRCGAPFGHYLLDDILDAKAKPKLNIFLANYVLDKKQRTKMSEVGKNSACVYALATGLVNADTRKFSLKSVKKATGFAVKYANDVAAMATPTEDGKKLGLKNPFGSGKKIKPLLSPIPEDGDVVLATLPDGDPAVILRNGKYPQLFVAVPEIPIELYKHMIMLAKVHVYTQDNACVYANGNYISVTALADGKVKLNIPSSKEVYDAIEWKKIGTAPNVTLDMKKGDALLLKLGK